MPQQPRNQELSVTISRDTPPSSSAPPAPPAAPLRFGRTADSPRIIMKDPETGQPYAFRADITTDEIMQYFSDLHAPAGAKSTDPTSTRVLSALGRAGTAALDQVNPMNTVKALLNPWETAANLGRTQWDQFRRAGADLETANKTTGLESFTRKLGGAAHLAAGMIPIVGPAIAHVGQRLGPEGESHTGPGLAGFMPHDTAGAVGETVGQVGLPLVAKGMGAVARGGLRVAAPALQNIADRMGLRAMDAGTPQIMRKIHERGMGGLAERNTGELSPAGWQPGMPATGQPARSASGQFLTQRLDSRGRPIPAGFDRVAEAHARGVARAKEASKPTLQKVIAPLTGALTGYAHGGGNIVEGLAGLTAAGALQEVLSPRVMSELSQKLFDLPNISPALVRRAIISHLLSVQPRNAEAKPRLAVSHTPTTPGRAPAPPPHR